MSGSYRYKFFYQRKGKHNTNSLAFPWLKDCSQTYCYLEIIGYHWDWKRVPQILLNVSRYNFPTQGSVSNQYNIKLHRSTWNISSWSFFNELQSMDSRCFKEAWQSKPNVYHLTLNETLLHCLMKNLFKLLHQIADSNYIYTIFFIPFSHSRHLCAMQLQEANRKKLCNLFDKEYFWQTCCTNMKCQDIKDSLRSSANISKEIQRSDYESFSRPPDLSSENWSLNKESVAYPEWPSW